MTKNEILKSIIKALEAERKDVKDAQIPGAKSEFETILHFLFVGEENGLAKALEIVKEASYKEEREFLNSFKPQGKFAYADLKRGMSLLAMKICMLICDVACLQEKAESSSAFDEETIQLKVLSDLLDNAQEYLDFRTENLSFEDINPDEVEDEFHNIIIKETK